MRGCVCGHVCHYTYAFVCFHFSGKLDQCTCGNVFGEVEAASIGKRRGGGEGGEGRGGGGDLVSRSHFLDTLKNGSHLGCFSLAAVKLSDSNLATRLQSGNHMCSPHPCLSLSLSSFIVKL